MLLHVYWLANGYKDNDNIKTYSVVTMARFL